MELEARGVACIVIATDKFHALARELGEYKSFSPRVVSIEHPLGGVGSAGVATRAKRALEAILSFLD
jgi:hypothetical protein